MHIVLLALRLFLPTKLSLSNPFSLSLYCINLNELEFYNVEKGGGVKGEVGRKRGWGKRERGFILMPCMTWLLAVTFLNNSLWIHV